MRRVESGRVRSLAVACAVLACTAPGAVTAQSPSPDPGTSNQAQVVTLGADRELGKGVLLKRSTWGLVDQEGVKIEAEDGGIRIRQEGKSGSDWTWRDPLQSVPVMRVATDTTFDRGPGEAGPMCGSSGKDPSFYGAIATTDGGWVIIRLEGSDLTVVARGDLPAAAPGEGTTTRLELECAVTGDAGDRIAMWVDGTNVADVTDATSIGPFSRPGLYAGIHGDRFEALFTAMAVKGGDTFAPVVTTVDGGTDASPGPSGSPAPDASGDPGTATPVPSLAPVPSEVAPTPLPVGSLLAAVPEDIAAGCRTVEPDAATGQLEAILCVPGGSLDSAEYYRYATADDLDAAFTRLVPGGADVTGADCSAGGSMTEFTVSGRTAGLLACYDDPRGGVTMQWSNRDLLVLAFGTSRSGSYADAYAWWQAAGPFP